MPQFEMRQKDYDRLKRISKSEGVPMTEIISGLLDLKGVKKIPVEEKEDVAICDNCEKKVPKDADFCPYCGVEFEFEEEEEEEEESED